MFSNCLKSPLSRRVIAASTPKVQCLSSMPNQSIRSYPQYTVYGENCMLSVKVLMPAFKVLRSNTLVLDGNKKGRILLEWTPRTADGGVNRDSQLRFGLSPEEVGLILDQLPNHPVELARRVPPGGENGGGSIGGVMSEDTPDKVLRITPGAGGSVSFRIDYEKDGVGGQSPAYGEDHASGPLEVTAQLGEVQVVREIIRSSIPALVGWTTMLEVAMRKSIDDARNSSPDFGGNNGGNGGNVPF